MAIVQVSRITHRKGLSENLPQLAGAEFGWVIDQRRLFIGNGTLEEGAPTVGNTEILTENSDILNITDTYTYKGQSGGYTVQTGVTAGSPVTRTLQSKIDDFASIKDFGATGDGTTDDTDAINRALFQIFCREANSQVRRSLFFPAGIYKITSSILVPPFAKLYGEGADSTIIQLQTADTYALRTADSNQQSGVNIANNAASPPLNIEIFGMSFHSTVNSNLVLIEKATQMTFSDVNFVGPFLSGSEDLESDSPNISCVTFNSTDALKTRQINFDRCKFSGCTYGITTNARAESVTISNSRFQDLFRGVVLGTGTLQLGGPVGFRIQQCLFDAIYREGILIGQAELNASAYNIFLDVGNEFGGTTPTDPNISFQNDNNVSVSDMFERTEGNSLIQPRVKLNDTKSFALENGERYRFGSYVQEAGQSANIEVTGSATEFLRVRTSLANAFTLKYNFKDPLSNVIRYGTLTVVAQDSDDSSGTLTYSDDYSENGSSGLVLSAEHFDANNVSIKYTAVSAGTIKYSFDHF